MNNYMLQITYSSNDLLFEGLYFSILSILRRTKECIRFYLLTGDLRHINPKYLPLSQKHIEELTKLVKDFNPSNEIVVKDCTSIYMQTFGMLFDVMYFTPYALFRLLLHKFDDIKGLILYLDVDTLTNNDIKMVWNVDMNGVEMCVCKDYYLNQTKQSNLPMFNTGVMLINMDVIRQTHYFDKANDFLVKNKPMMADQQALYWTWDKLKVWKDEFRYNYQKIGIADDTIVKHFCCTEANAIGGKLVKPWNLFELVNLLQLHNWDEDIKYFLQHKKEW